VLDDGGDATTTTTTTTTTATATTTATTTPLLPNMTIHRANNEKQPLRYGQIISIDSSSSSGGGRVNSDALDLRLAEVWLCMPRSAENPSTSTTAATIVDFRTRYMYQRDRRNCIVGSSNRRHFVYVDEDDRFIGSGTSSSYATPFSLWRLTTTAAASPASSSSTPKHHQCRHDSSYWVHHSKLTDNYRGIHRLAVVDNTTTTPSPPAAQSQWRIIGWTVDGNDYQHLKLFNRGGDDDTSVTQGDVDEALHVYFTTRTDDPAPDCD
jgi:hypothetical protein